MKVLGDRQILASVVTNLLQNAFRFTRANRHIVLRVRATADRVFIEVEDQCVHACKRAAPALMS